MDTHDDADPEAARTSAALTALIREEIAAAGGWIRFSRFMELALYAPALGYYSAGSAKLGRDPAAGSDFVTAPELTPLFGRAVARPVAAVLAAGGETILELGGGTGRLAADLLSELEALDALPASYLMLDVSADLRDRQRATLERDVPHLVSRVRWPTALPDRIDGVVVANEVLDALPVELVVSAGERWLLRGVTVDGGRFVHADIPLPDDLASFAAAVPAGGLPPGYQTEWHPAGAGLVSSIAERLSPRSVAFFIDYGFAAAEYYHPQRGGGTVMTHRRHRAGVDPLVDVGLQDITAHVNFSAMAAAAEAVGAPLVGYTTQAAFLIDCGIAGLLSGSAADVLGWGPQAAALQRLMSEAEMGELFKVLAVGHADEALPGFRGRDRTQTLLRDM